ncbi:hypothetical protein RH831_10510 [Halodesulfurarchaeum sp. HSR-GB]|uniref:hypothetical protein n=1 Tax=Halodesulfurarchaeum sp. HSR-GB TaxID=3074077 RepID=UPI00285DD98D|nr:hypothetical protein [Halodesulfurarchaeum sp. HSR-GB]MDR5657608.1 hypothetical protein [Halodesulfurarchaeum sp. HSR-GB]
MSKTGNEDQNGESTTLGQKDGLPMVRTTSTVEPWQMAYVPLKSDVNGSALLRDAISEQFEEPSGYNKQEITNALEKIHEHGISPKDAIKMSSSLTDLLNKPQTLSNE